MNFEFFLKSSLMGAGLAMDAFSVSLANGLNEPKMKKYRVCFVAGIFAFFQFLMPIIGYVCVKTVAKQFKGFEKAIPFIALFLLLFIGGKMLFEGIGKKEEQPEELKTGLGALLLQGVATSIDALSVGFTIAEYTTKMAFISCIIIAIVTFVICLLGIYIGKCCGTKLASKADVLGGTILILIGIEIFITGVI